jgi:hypothetical protein
VWVFTVLGPLVCGPSWDVPPHSGPRRARSWEDRGIRYSLRAEVWVSLSINRWAGRVRVSKCRAFRGAVRKAPAITFTPSLKTRCTLVRSVFSFGDVAHNWHPYERTGRQTALNTWCHLAGDSPLCMLPRRDRAFSEAKPRLHMVVT